MESDTFVEARDFCNFRNVCCGIGFVVFFSLLVVMFVLGRLANTTAQLRQDLAVQSAKLEAIERVSFSEPGYGSGRKD